jgi:hypothetical protein
MTPRQWFALVLRTLGAMSLVNAVDYLTTAYDVFKGLYSTSISPLGQINHAVVHVALGLAMIYFADKLSALIVPAQRRIVAPEMESAP